MDFKDKIDKLKTVTGLSLNKLERILSVNGTLYKAYNDNREPIGDLVQKIQLKFNVRKEWWEAGEGEMVAPGKNNNLVEEPGQDYGQKLLQSMEDNIETLKRENKLLRAILQKAGIEL